MRVRVQDPHCKDMRHRLLTPLAEDLSRKCLVLATYIRNSQQHALGKLHAPTAPGILLCSSALLTTVVDNFFLLFPNRHWRPVKSFYGGMTDGERKTAWMLGDEQVEREAHRRLPARLCFCPTNRWNCPPHTSPWSQFTGPSDPLTMGMEGALLSPIGSARVASIIRALPGTQSLLPWLRIKWYRTILPVSCSPSASYQPLDGLKSGGRENRHLLSTSQLALNICWEKRDPITVRLYNPTFALCYLNRLQAWKRQSRKDIDRFVTCRPNWVRVQNCSISKCDKEICVKPMAVGHDIHKMWPSCADGFHHIWCSGIRCKGFEC